MFRRLSWFFGMLVALWLGVSLVVGWSILPRLLLQAPIRPRTDFQREEIRRHFCADGAAWESATISGGEGASLDVWRLRRPETEGVALLLHGFGDDAWGVAYWAEELEDWDVVTFTFRGRDRNPSIPATLGGWEREDVSAVVRHLEAQGTPRSRILIVAGSQGAGVALLALSDIEKQGGGPLGGALLESPYRDLAEAASNHLKGALGPFEILARPAECLALWRAGRLAHFDPYRVSPEKASRGLKTPVALLTGDRDIVTPLEGVQAIASNCPDLTIVPGAGHGEAASRVPGGWSAWARPRMERWGF